MTIRQRISEAIPLLLLTILTLPVILGYVWLVIATFSRRTYGLIPVDAHGNFGGLTLENWTFLVTDKEIWPITLNTFILAVGLTVGVVLISAMAGYALSRIRFAGRQGFLAMTLILHAFPSVTLLISIYFVLRWISEVPE